MSESEQSTAARWADLQRLYHEALECLPEDRASFVREACTSDQWLRSELESLLAQDEVAGDFLEQQALGLAAKSLAGDAVPAAGIEPGTLLGPYKIVDRIAQGGMGIVYRAEQQYPVRRTVALKVIRPGMDSEHVIARFEAERQALALMDHPHIARVFDAGTTPSGRLYFVMELVDGQPITDYSSGLGLSLPDRLKMFIPVCQAIQHAHQKGVIHRDIKPSNILTGTYDGVPVPKVIDFGIAKAMQEPLTDRSMHTQAGGRVGTLQYMSPEQAGTFGQDVDTRTDVYSLGAVLYELVAGSSPLNRATLEHSGEVDIVRRICEEDPPKPSVRMRDRKLAAKGDAKRPYNMVRPDLDWVVMKAIEKDRNRRYETPNALARDIERYLRGDGVEARPASAGYRLRVFARRYRLFLTVAASFIILLTAATALTSWQALRARTAERAAQQQRDRALSAESKAREDERRAREERLRAVSAEAQALRESKTALAEKARADVESQTAQAVASFLQEDLLSQADASDQRGPANMQRGPDLTVRVALDRAAQRIVGKFSGRPAVEGAIRKTLGDTYNNLGLYSEAAAQLEQAVTLLAASLGKDHPDTLFAMDRLATVYQNEGKLAQAEAMMKRELESRRSVFGPRHRQTWETINNLGVLYVRMGKYSEAEPYVLQGIAQNRQNPGPDGEDLSTALNNLGLLYNSEKKYDLAAAALTEAVARRERNIGPDHPKTLVSLSNLALSRKGQGNLAESIALNRKILEARRRVLGPEHPSTLRTMQNLAGALIAASQYTESESLLLTAWEAAKKQTSLDPSEARSMARKLVDLYTETGKADDAREWQKRADAQ